jgi:VWFA-related protein
MNNLLGFFFCFVSLLLNAYGQTPQNQDFSIKVGGEEVRIDATVLDRKGRQVTDLTADDFELYQDGKTQKITSCTYVNEYQAQPSPKPSKTKDLQKNEIRRAIAFVIDPRSFEEFNDARMALRKFVESQMQPGDMVSIWNLRSGIGSLQRFFSDK